MARQIVSHGHVFVNGKKLSIPSFHVKVDDIISLSPKMQQNGQVLEATTARAEPLPYLAREGLQGKLTRQPKRDDVEVPFNTQHIIEYYSR